MSFETGGSCASSVTSKRRRSSVCPVVGCHELMPCSNAEHTPKPWQGSDRRSELPPDWDRRRQRVLERDGFRCVSVTDGRRCVQDATDVDHIDDPLDHDERNLQSLCHPHHDEKTKREAAAGRRRSRR